MFSIVHFYSHCITDILVLQMKGGSLKAVYFTSVCVKVWLWRKRLKFVASFRTCLAPSQKWLNAISRIWILSESMGNLFISLKFYLKEKLMSIFYRMISITHDYTCDFCNFSSQEGDLSVWITCYLQASPPTLLVRWRLLFVYRLFISACYFFYPQATCHFVICLLPWKLSSCMGSRENSPWSLWHI